jgi:hypothetical protein
VSRWAVREWLNGAASPRYSRNLVALTRLEAEFGAQEFCSASHWCCLVVRDVQARLQTRPRSRLPE